MIEKDYGYTTKKQLNMKLSDGAEIYIEYFDSKKPYTILFIHGGPGESCVSFSYFATFVSQHFNVVMLDQRGVMRSHAESRPEYLTIIQVIKDFEEIRKLLDIEKWFILGHSFGGYIAMRYVLSFPESIQGVIYENPCFDIEHSLCAIIKEYIKYYDSIGDCEKKQKTENILLINDIVRKFDAIIAFPDLDRKRVFKSEAITAKCRECYDASLINAEAIERCVQHYNVIKFDKSLKNEYLSKLEKVARPSLLIQGEKDPMLPSEDKKQWLRNPIFSTITVADVGHYVHSDAPEIMAEILYEYINDTIN